MLLTICILLLVFGLSGYISGKKGIGALIFFFFLTDGFHFLNKDWFSIKYTDFAIIYLFGISFINLLTGNFSFFKPKNKIFKWAVLIGIYISIEFIRTIVFKEEIAYYALANYRTYLPFFSFFIVQELDYKEQKDLLKQIAIITVLSTILYVLQPLLEIQIFQHARITEENGTLRFRNIPYLVYFYLLYATIIFKFTDIKSVLLLVLFIIAIVLTQHRAVFLAYGVIIIVYLALSRKAGKAVQYGIIGIFLFLFVGDAVLTRFEAENRETTTWEDIQNVINLRYESVIEEGYKTESDGTLSFRVLLLTERIQFILEHPKYTLFGIGTRHEDSPYTENEFDFTLGSSRKNVDGDMIKIGQTSSGDLAWLNPLMRFGVIGITLLICFSFLILRYLYKNRKQSDLAMSAFLFYLFLILISFKNDHLYGNMQMFFVYLLIAHIDKISRRGGEQKSYRKIENERTLERLVDKE